MTFGFLQAAVLFGLAGLTIPVIIHLWNRRRAPIVDWGAMQFLRMQPAQTRRLRLEEILLLMLRLAAVALVALALAGPIARGPGIARMKRPPRDVVFIIDAAARMDRRDVTPNPWNRAWELVAHEVGQLGSGDRWTIVIASRPIETPFDGFRSSHEDVDWRAMQNEFTANSAGNIPAAIARAWNDLDERGKHPEREIVVISDGSRDGWIESPEWERLASRWAHADTSTKTKLRYRVACDELPAMPTNYRVSFSSAPRTAAGVGQRVRFEVRVAATASAQRPAKLRLKIDDQLFRDADLSTWDEKLGQGDLFFDHVFLKPGVHHVRVELESPTRDGRLIDAFAEDDHCDVVVQVVADFPVLIVDGVERLTPDSPAFYLMNAFADAADKNRMSLIAPKRVAWNRFEPEDFKGRPHVVILADVPSLNASQAVALDPYVREGGAILVLLGPRAQPKSYATFHVAGESGWLPFQLTEPATAPKSVGIDDTTIRSPALAVFRSKDRSSLANLAFSRWWRGKVDPKATVQATFVGGDPWLIDRSIGKGRVTVSTAPFDQSWDNNLASSWEFPVLAHELAFALLQGSSPPLNLAPGEPIRLTPALFDPPLLAPTLPLAGVLERPGGASRPVVISTWPGIVDAPGPRGVYRLRVGDRAALPIVVGDGERVGEFAPLTADDKRRLSEIVPITWNDESSEQGEIGQAEVGRWMFIGLLAILCFESWLARRMAGDR